ETEDALIRPFTESFGSEAVIRLSDLSGAQVKDLVNARWCQFSKYDIPFDLAGVEKTFEAPARSVGRILEIFSKLIVVKVPEKVDGPTWPQAADLKHDLDDLKHYLGIIDGY